MNDNGKRLVAVAGECMLCLQPFDMCECGGIEHARRVALSEDESLRRVADRAIARGYVQLTRRRGLWRRLRDAWHAFWHGLA